MAAILGRQARDERRAPHRLERMDDAVRREARVLGVDEQEAPGGIDAEFVHVEVGHRLSPPRHEEAVEMLVGALIGAEDVLEAPDLRETGEEQGLAVAGHPHGAQEVALVQRQGSVGRHADEVEVAALVRREGERASMHREPLRERPRAADGPGQLAGLLLWRIVRRRRDRSLPRALARLIVDVLTHRMASIGSGSGRAREDRATPLYTAETATPALVPELRSSNRALGRSTPIARNSAASSSNSGSEVWAFPEGEKFGLSLEAIAQGATGGCLTASPGDAGFGHRKIVMGFSADYKARNNIVCKGRSVGSTLLKW